MSVTGERYESRDGGSAARAIAFEFASNYGCVSVATNA